MLRYIYLPLERFTNHPKCQQIKLNEMILLNYIYAHLVNTAYPTVKKGASVFIQFSLAQVARDLWFLKSRETIRQAIKGLETRELIESIAESKTAYRLTQEALEIYAQNITVQNMDSCPESGQLQVNKDNKSSLNNNNVINTNTLNTKVTCKKKEAFEIFGQLQNVYLRPSELEDIRKIYPRVDVDAYIEHLSLWFGKRPEVAENRRERHHLTIRQWILRDTKPAKSESTAPIKSEKVLTVQGWRTHVDNCKRTSKGWVDISAMKQEDIDGLK